MTLMEITKKAYIEDGGKHCPYCGSDIVTLTFGPLVPDEELVYQSVTCTVCKNSWHDIFRLVGIHEEDE
jgi:C4-type Zn-finger protein